MGSFFGNLLKLGIMAALAGVLTVGAFFAGAILYGPYLQTGPDAATISSSFSGPAASAPTQVIINSDDIPQEFGVFWEAWNFIEQEFYGEIPTDQTRVYGAVRGMVNSFGDENTAFIDPTRAAIMQEDVSGAFEGIGASVRLDDSGRLVIAEPFIGRPAAKAGLQRGDIVLEVDGQSLQGYSLYEAVLLIRGPAGSTVTLLIFRTGIDEPFEVDIIRERIEIEIVESRLLEGNIGYAHLSDFSHGASGKLKTAYDELIDQGAETLILDLRNNPGGLLSESVAVSSLFLDGENVLIERLKSDQEKIYQARGPQVDTDIPLVVLINRGSASASEIVAGALKEHHRAILLGEQSFGKGTVQLPHTLSDGSEIRVTIAEWLTPNGNQIHKEGIVPDIIVDFTQEDFVEGRDPQLERAIEYIQENF
ncbi:MAG: S41 family peptidase [Anaerolineae bacterium]